MSKVYQIVIDQKSQEYPLFFSVQLVYFKVKIIGLNSDFLVLSKTELTRVFLILSKPELPRFSFGVHLFKINSFLYSFVFNLILAQPVFEIIERLSLSQFNPV